MNWQIIKTMLCFWQWVPFLLRRQLPDQEFMIRAKQIPADPPPAVIVLIGAANQTDGTASPQGQAAVARAKAYLLQNPNCAPDMYILCVSGNKFGAKTEAEALVQECRNQGLDQLVISVVCLDPLNGGPVAAMQDVGSVSKGKWFLDPATLTTNTWENLQRVLDYCYWRQWNHILLIGHPIHLTYAWPIMLHLHNQLKAKHLINLFSLGLQMGMLNSKQTEYDHASPQPRWRSYWRFWLYAVLAKVKQTLNGWTVLPYIRKEWC